MDIPSIKTGQQLHHQSVVDQPRSDCWPECTMLQGVMPWYVWRVAYVDREAYMGARGNHCQQPGGRDPEEKEEGEYEGEATARDGI